MSKCVASLLAGAMVVLTACGGGGSSSNNGSSSSSSSGAPVGSADCSAAGVTTTGAWPDASNTGVPAGTVLTPSGSITVTTDGAIVEKLDVTGSITVHANNVTIRKVRITSDDYYPIRYFDNGGYTGLLVEDSEIVGLSGLVTNAIGFQNYTARRLNIHGMADGLKADANVLIEDSWIHDLSNGNGEHNDGVQSSGGANVTIRHNSISGASNAAVMAGPDFGDAVVNLRIENNLLAGGGYTLNLRGTGALQPTGTRVTGNCFIRNAAYGPWAIDDASPVVTDNRYSDGMVMSYP